MSGDPWLPAATMGESTVSKLEGNLAFRSELPCTPPAAPQRRARHPAPASAAQSSHPPDLTACAAIAAPTASTASPPTATTAPPSAPPTRAARRRVTAIAAPRLAGALREAALSISGSRRLTRRLTPGSRYKRPLPFCFSTSPPSYYCTMVVCTAVTCIQTAVCNT